MSQTIPSQCPECSAVAVDATQVPPDRHDRGDEWLTRAECAACGDYLEWF